MKLFAVVGGNTYEIVAETDANGRKRGRIVPAHSLIAPCEVVTRSENGATVVAMIRVANDMEAGL